MNKKILILGKGFIGNRLKQELKAPATSRKIHCYEDVEKIIKHYKPKILINAIGHTGKSNVDDCELVKDKTITLNTHIPILLAEACLRHNVKLIHISSGCIYHFNYKKQKSITEALPPDYYELFYSRTKIYSDMVINHLSKKYDMLITRVRVPLDSQPHPKNILTKLIKYKNIIDVPNSVTYIPDYIRALKHLIKINARGIYNVALKGGIRYSKLLDIYRKYDPEFHYKIINLKQLKLVRTNLILSTKKLEQSGFKITPTKKIMKQCVKEYVKY